MILTWQIGTEIEASLIEFLQAAITSASLQLLDQNGTAQTVNVYAGKVVKSDWSLPLIQIDMDSEPDLNRLEIGSNTRLKSRLIIIDVRTLLPGQEKNLADWVEETINDGFTVYSYTPNSSNPESPVKVVLGHGRVDFISSVQPPSFDDADVYDQNRWRITIKVWVQG